MGGTSPAWLRWVVAVLALLVGSLGTHRASADDAPTIAAPVTDLANVLTAEEEVPIAERLRAHRASTSVHIAVLLVRTTNGEPIDDFAHRVATAWGGGAKGEDKGALVVLAIDDRRSRIEVGHGLEASLPDAKARAILDNAKPLLRSQAYRAAVHMLVEELIVATGGARRETAPSGSRPDASSAKPKRPPIDPASVPWTVRKLGWVAVLLYVAALLFVSSSPHLRRRLGVDEPTGRGEAQGTAAGPQSRRELLRSLALPTLPFALVPLLLPSAYWLPTSLFPAIGTIVAIVALLLEARADDDRKRRVRIVSRVAGSAFLPLFGLSLSGALVPYPSDATEIGSLALFLAPLGALLCGWLTSSYDPSLASSSTRTRREPWELSYSSSGGSDSSSGGGSDYGGGGSFGGGGASSDW